jgi:hypothetical protein
MWSAREFINLVQLIGWLDLFTTTGLLKTNTRRNPKASPNAGQGRNR